MSGNSPLLEEDWLPILKPAGAPDTQHSGRRRFFLFVVEVARVEVARDANRRVSQHHRLNTIDASYR
jgi:hypothetical protein